MAPVISKTPQEAAVQLTREGHSWSATLGIAPAPTTYGFRATAPSGLEYFVYETLVDLLGTATYEFLQRNTFSRFNAFQIGASERAIDLWSAVSNVQFARVGVGQSGEVAYTANATILFAMTVRTPWGLIHICHRLVLLRRVQNAETFGTTLLIMGRT
jgi:hypothetical protein